MTIASLPIRRVVVMEDRAQIERIGELALGEGPQSFEIAGITPIAVDRSVEVEVVGARLRDARIVRRWRARPPGDLPHDASELRRRVHALAAELGQHQDEVARAGTQCEQLAIARADLFRAIAELTGVGKTDVDRWSVDLDALSERDVRAHEALRRANKAQAHTQELLGQARAALRIAETEDHDLECTLAITLEGDGTAEVRARYLVPCAAWRPAYRATLRGDTVALESEAVVWQRTGEDWTDVAISFSTARPTLGTTPPHLAEDRLSTRPKLEAEKRTVDVAMREVDIPTTGEGGTGELPGVDDGGETRVLAATGPATVTSDGQPQRVPLGRFEAPATIERVCPAEAGTLVYAVARFANASPQVLLAGPADLVRDSGFVGRSRLDFTAPGATAKLSFGSEDGLVVVRHRDETRDESRLTGKKTVRTSVTWHVSNASAEPRSFVIEERIPVSEVKDVEIDVLARHCDPPPVAVSKDGIARIELSLPPHGTKRGTFTWELTATAKVAGV
ncbi:MAG TPA: mucoidy inhibitor MuiA family protein [Nannocystaceae bacterium]|nr:mucoidy inhibitor MuiA family protein [Nannocystaceae bacterium]